MRHSIRLILALLLSNAYFQLHAQSAAETAASPPEYRHELGLDITGTALLFTQFGESYYSYNPVYNLTYRHRGAKGNWRFGLGGYLQERELEPHHPEYSDAIRGYTRQVQARAGYEWESQLANKWSAFYGLDLRGDYTSSKTTYGYGGDQIPVAKRSSWSLGVAPVLGLRWRVSNRISLLTEAALAVSYSKNREEVRYLPVGEGVEAIPAELESGSAVGARFTPPLAFFVTVDL